MIGVTIRQFWEACRRISRPYRNAALLVEFGEAQRSETVLGNRTALVIQASTEMFLDINGSAAAGDEIRLRVVWQRNSRGAVGLSTEQKELLPQLIGVIAETLLHSRADVRLVSSDTNAAEAFSLVWNDALELNALEQAAQDQFNSSPFALTASDRFMIAQVKNCLTSSNESAGGQERATDSITPPCPPTPENNQMPLPSNEFSSASRGLFDAPPPVSASDMRELRKHVINLSMGRFSQDGSFTSSKESVAAIFDVHLKEWIEEQGGGPTRLLLYAHGGLTAEGWGLYTAAFQMRWWKEQGVYPIFFVWETGLLETLGQIFSSGQRRLPSDTTRGTISQWAEEGLDFSLEFAVRRLGGPRVWAGMKTSAEQTFADSGDGRLVLNHIKEFTAVDKTLEIHAVGHSAGSIFLSHALKTAAKMELPKCESVHFLAPAITCRLFEDTLKPLVGSGAKNTVNFLSLFTMNDAYERDDTTGPYNKSLLYLICKALEPDVDTPILGLEQSLLGNPGLKKFFGLNGSKNANTQVIFSVTDTGAPLDSRSTSKSHGDFDNDAPTMESVLRRILKATAKTIIKPFPEDGNVRAVARMQPLQSGTPIASSAPINPPVYSTVSDNGNRLALCIGIDEYPGRNRLSGCVNDCNSWARWLSSRKFNVQQLTNGQATRAAMLSAIRNLFDNSRPGDVIAIQYAGHGTTVPDVNGDEAEGDTPGRDESLVPIDFEAGNLLLDDDLGELCKTIKDGVNVTFFMDCCNSGTNTRMFMSNLQTTPANSKARFLDLPAEVVQAHVRNREMGQTGMRAFGASPYTGTREILFAACRSNEVALETNGQGDFTRNAMAVLQRAGDMTAEQFYAAVLQQFGAAARQTPGLWCADSLRQSILLGQVRV